MLIHEEPFWLPSPPVTILSSFLGPQACKHCLSAERPIPASNRMAHALIWVHTEPGCSRAIPLGLRGTGPTSWCVHVHCRAQSPQELLGACLTCTLNIKIIKAAGRNQPVDLPCGFHCPQPCHLHLAGEAAAPRPDAGCQPGGNQAHCILLPHPTWHSHGVPAAAPEPARAGWKW